jgi:hypothetical protein
VLGTAVECSSTMAIIAPPPVLSTRTASAASENADPAPLLIFVRTTKRRDVLGAAESVKATGATLTGAVLVGKDEAAVDPQRAVADPQRAVARK